MKRFLILFLIFIPAISFSQLGDDGKTRQPDAKASNTSATFKHSVFAQSHIPTSWAGLKYAYLNNWGGYAAFTTDFLIGYEVIQGTVGITKRIVPDVYGYLGGGLDFYWEEVIADVGIIIKFGRVGLSIGGGFDFMDPEYSYGSVGIGVNF